MFLLTFKVRPEHVQILELPLEDGGQHRVPRLCAAAQPVVRS